MSLHCRKILGICITTDPKEKILEYIEKYLDQSDGQTQNPLVIATPNAEQVVFSRQHAAFAGLLNRADVTIPDGIGPVWASRVLPGVPIPGRVSGIDLMRELVRIASDRGVRIGLIGGYHGLAFEAFECLRRKHPKLDGWADDGPELTGEAGEAVRAVRAAYWEDLARKIRQSGTRIVFVGLGAPKQEYVIDMLRRTLTGIRQPVVLMSVGGSFDFIAGRLKRAPVFMRLIGFEWLWRLFQEPWRWRRQTALVTFAILVLKDRFRTR